MTWVAECQAGTVLKHPDRPGWQEPCSYVRVATAIIVGGGQQQQIELCAIHLAELDELGIVSWQPRLEVN